MMELLLNLAWLLLLAPACVLWRRRARHTSGTLALLTLACLLLILFPVISVSDDLSLMRAEMEDLSGPERQVSAASGKHQTVNHLVFDAVYLLTAMYSNLESRWPYQLDPPATARQSCFLVHAAAPRSPPVTA